MLDVMEKKFDAMYDFPIRSTFEAFQRLNLGSTRYESLYFL